MRARYPPIASGDAQLSRFGASGAWRIQYPFEGSKMTVDVATQVDDTCALYAEVKGAGTDGRPDGIGWQQRSG